MNTEHYRDSSQKSMQKYIYQVYHQPTASSFYFLKRPSTTDLVNLTFTAELDEYGQYIHKDITKKDLAKSFDIYRQKIEKQ